MLASHTASLSSDGSMPFPAISEREMAPATQVRTKDMSLPHPLRMESVLTFGMDLKDNSLLGSTNTSVSLSISKKSLGSFGLKIMKRVWPVASGLNFV